MDTSRKKLEDYNTCNFCVYYSPLMKNGKKHCTGICKATNHSKQRTDKCKKLFRSKMQTELF